MRNFVPPSVMLYTEPLPAGVVVPNVHAHLSAFSAPRLSYQAFRSGSVVASSNSWAITLIMASPAGLLFGELEVCTAHEDRLALASPTKEYLMSLPRIVPRVCQPQYCVRKPLVSFTSLLVSTKYTPRASFGKPPEPMALETTACTPASESDAPWE